MFKDRVDAGRQLGEKLKYYHFKDPIIFGIPRGGVVCAAEVSLILKTPLSIVVARKIGHPENPEYAIGAVDEDGCVELTAEARHVDKVWLDRAVERERQEAYRRKSVYLQGMPLVSPEGKTAILVDDGLATGLTMLVAIKYLKQFNPLQIVVAVPVGAVDTIHRISEDVDEIVVLEVPDNFFGSIGMYYTSFDQVSDEEVIAILKSANTQIKK